MTTSLIVLAFNNERAAFEVRDHLIKLQKEHLIRLQDAAVAVRRLGGRLKIKQVLELSAEGALGGAFWGLMAGILFWMPFFGLAVGTLIGLFAGSLNQEYGIHDDFITDVSRCVEPGQSALFILVVEATYDRVIEEICHWHPRILRTNLSREQEKKLRESFSDADIDAHMTQVLKDPHATQKLPQAYDTQPLFERS